MKQLFHYGPAAAFLIAYFTSDIYVATGVLIVSLVLAAAASWLINKEMDKMLTVGAALATVLGGLTLLIRDPVFIKLKPSALYAVFGLVLAGSHFIGDKPLMARVPPSVIELPQTVWGKINAAWAVFFIFCAALNLAIAYTLSESTWVLVKTFGFSALIVLFMFAHIPFIYQYLPQDDPADASTADASTPKQAP